MEEKQKVGIEIQIDEYTAIKMAIPSVMNAGEAIALVAKLKGLLKQNASFNMREEGFSLAGRKIVTGGRKHKTWSEEENQYVRENFNKKTIAEIAEYLDRTETAIYNHATALGLRREIAEKEIGVKIAPAAKPPVESLENESSDEKKIRLVKTWKEANQQDREQLATDNGFRFNDFAKFARLIYKWEAELKENGMLNGDENGNSNI